MYQYDRDIFVLLDPDTVCTGALYGLPYHLSKLVKIIILR